MTVATDEGEGGGAGLSLDPQRMRFKEVEERFRSQFSMPHKENLVNCKLT